MKIGVVGFSRNQFDQSSARKIIQRELQRLATMRQPETVELVSGYTNTGVPKIVYEEGRALGFKLVGFSAAQALRIKAGVFPVDKVLLFGERFGDESSAFVNYVDGLLRVGGGPQSRREVVMFKERFKDGTISRRLKEFEVEWYGKQPAPSSAVVPKTITLEDGRTVKMFQSVSNLMKTGGAFNELWSLHPADFHTINIHGKTVNTPRWQQAYGRNYVYSGSRNNALPIPNELEPYLKWSQQNVDPRLNGLLVNWYDGAMKHYIGAHRDSTIGLLPDSPIVTISLGQERIFRLRPYGGKGYVDLILNQGDVLVIPAITNQHWTHEVPNFKRYDQKRISITLRAYQN